MQVDVRPVLVSSCLAGLCTRYDAQPKSYPELDILLKETNWVPVCPEQLGGLPTPREAADIQGGTGKDVLEGTAKVIGKSGADYTDQFIHGARQVLQIARMLKAERAFLKGGSPSCGFFRVKGVTAALLEQNNIKISEFG